jgi:limonene 1,2-monooxygenase
LPLPYHHPFNIAQRIAHLDHLSHGGAILGVGPGALPSDAVMLGIDPMTQRDRMDEGLGVILRLRNEEEPITIKSDWFTLQDAALQLRPLQAQLPVAVASTISPSGMKTAGKYGVGVLSIASYSEEGLMDRSCATSGRALHRNRRAQMGRWGRGGSWDPAGYSRGLPKGRRLDHQL